MAETKFYPSRSVVGPMHDYFRELYDHMYQTQGELAKLKGERDKSGAVRGERRIIEPGGPSNTKIGGLYLEAKPPEQAAQVANLSGIPILGYDPTTGQIRWFKPM